jgi:hypothetical protein
LKNRVRAVFQIPAFLTKFCFQFSQKTGTVVRVFWSKIFSEKKWEFLAENSFWARRGTGPKFFLPQKSKKKILFWNKTIKKKVNFQKNDEIRTVVVLVSVQVCMLQVFHLSWT